LISRLGAIDPSDGGRTQRFSLYSEWSRKGDKSLTEANAYLTYYRLHLFSNFTFFLDDLVNGDQFEQSDQRVVVGLTFRTLFSKSMMVFRGVLSS
jgi:hypothetical protein